MHYNDDTIKKLYSTNVLDSHNSQIYVSRVNLLLTVAGNFQGRKILQINKKFQEMWDMFLIQKISIHNHPKVDDYFLTYESSKLGWLWSSQIISLHFWTFFVISLWMKFTDAISIPYRMFVINFWMRLYSTIIIQCWMFLSSFFGCS